MTEQPRSAYAEQLGVQIGKSVDVPENWLEGFKRLADVIADDGRTIGKLQRFTTMSSYLLYGLGQGQIGFLKGVKAALAEMGLIQNFLAAPFSPFSGRELAAVRKNLKLLQFESGLPRRMADAGGCLWVDNYAARMV